MMLPQYCTATDRAAAELQAPTRRCRFHSHSRGDEAEGACEHGHQLGHRAGAQRGALERLDVEAIQLPGEGGAGGG